MPQSRVAFADFYAEYHPRLVRFAAAAFGGRDADDVAQETMTRAYAAYDRYDPARDAWPWLTTIARHVAADARARAVPPRATEDLPAATDVAEQAEHRDLIRCALARLDPADRAVLVLRAWHDVSFGELARLAGRTPNAVRQQVFRARRRLAAEYDALGGRLLGLATPLATRWAQLRDRTVVVVQAAGALPAAALLGGAVVATVAIGPATAATGPAGPAAFGVTHAGPAARAAAPTRTARPVVAAGHGTATTRDAAPDPRPAPRAVVVESAQEGLPATSGSHRHDRGQAAAPGGRTAVSDHESGAEGRGVACGVLAPLCHGPAPMISGMHQVS